jgi:maltooligosyltrehalose trehalohydrolase
MQERLADPGRYETFEASKLDLSERERHAEVYQMHCDLMRLRREEGAFSAQLKGGVDGAVLAPEAFVLRFFAVDGDDRLLVVNLGVDLKLSPAPEPLLAPPENMRWKILWSSEDPRYGGSGTPALETEGSWRLPGHAALVMAPDEVPDKLEETRDE